MFVTSHTCVSRYYLQGTSGPPRIHPHDENDLLKNRTKLHSLYCRQYKSIEEVKAKKEADCREAIVDLQAPVTRKMKMHEQTKRCESRGSNIGIPGMKDTRLAREHSSGIS